MGQEPTLSDPWVPSQFSDSDEFKGRILDMAGRCPQAFKIMPAGIQPEGRGSWAEYPFDGRISLWVDTSHDEAIDFFRQKFSEEKEKTMTKALTTQEQSQVKSLLASNMKAIGSVLPKHLTPERMLRVTYQSIMQTPDLARCTQISLINGIIGASVVGLEIGGPLGLAHLIPFKNRETNTLEATLIIDYKGLIELIYKSPLVKNVSAQAVYEKDEFDYGYGTENFIRHRPCDNGHPGELTHAYCIVFFRGGGYEMEVVNREKAMAAKAHSRARDSKNSPWNTEDEWTMWVKTAVRRIAKRVPKSPELQKALAVDERAEKGESLDDVIDVDFSSVDVPGNGGGKKQEEPGEPPHPEPEEPVTENPPGQPEDETPEVEEGVDQTLLANYEFMKVEFPDRITEAVTDLKLSTPFSEQDIRAIYDFVSRKQEAEAM